MCDNLFFSLLRTALWDKEESLSLLAEGDVAEILEEAERQTVTALIFDAMTMYGIKSPIRVMLKYFSYSEVVKQYNRKLNAASLALGRLLSQNGVDYAIVKGQVLANLYPKPLLRQPGDIDFYCDSNDFERAKRIINQTWRIKFEENYSKKHLSFVYKGVAFEMHFLLIKFYNKRKNNYWECLLHNDNGSDVLIDGKPVKTLSPSLHTLYVFLHLYSHLMNLGIGLRQFCDLAVMLHACQSEIDYEELKQELKTLGMEKAFCACGSILVRQLGLPAEEFPYVLTDKDEHYANKILNVVFYRGNLGHYNKKSGIRGWKHNIESVCIKISHFIKFMPLAPGYSCHWLVYQLFKKHFETDSSIR